MNIQPCLARPRCLLRQEGFGSGFTLTGTPGQPQVSGTCPLCPPGTPADVLGTPPGHSRDTLGHSGTPLDTLGSPGIPPDILGKPWGQPQDNPGHPWTPRDPRTQQVQVPVAGENPRGTLGTQPEMLPPVSGTGRWRWGHRCHQRDGGRSPRALVRRERGIFIPKKRCRR